MPVASILCNVADEDETAEKFAETVDFLGHVDACFANAGVSSNRRATKDGFAGMSTKEWRRVLDVNLDGVFFTLRAAANQHQCAGAGARTPLVHGQRAEWLCEGVGLGVDGEEVAY